MDRSARVGCGFGAVEDVGSTGDARCGRLWGGGAHGRGIVKQVGQIDVHLLGVRYCGTKTHRREILEQFVQVIDGGSHVYASSAALSTRAS